MKVTKLVGLVALLVLLSGGVFAAAKAEPELDGPITIDFWFSVGGNSRAATEVLVARFNESQDRITVDASFGGSYSDLKQRLLAAVVTDETPVVAQMALANIARFLVDGRFEGLTPYMEADPDIADGDYIPEQLTLVSYEGEVYGIPFNLSNPVLFYNKDLFRQAGLDPDDPPETWEEAYEAGAAISALGDDIYGIDVVRASGWMTQGYTWQFGGDWIAADNSTVEWAEGPAVDALAFMQKVVNDGVGVYNASMELDLSGKVGMVLRSTASVTRWIESAPFDLGVARVPYSVRPQVPTGGGSLHVFKNASQAEKDAAWEFLKFMSNRESQIYWAQTTGYQASNTQALNDPAFRAFIEADPRYNITYEQIPFSVAEDNTRLIPFSEVRDIFNDAWDRVILNNMDPATELGLAQEQANKVLADND